jgi:hypothetical protein
MQEVFFRKGRVTFTAISIFLLSLGYLLMIPLLLEKQPRHVDGVLYFVLTVVYFGALVLLLVNCIYLKLFWLCVIRRHPALMLTADSLHAYHPSWGAYCILPWQRIEAFVPYTYKGHTTYYIVLKDYETYRQQVSSPWRRFILWMDGLIVARSVINIDIRSMDADAGRLLDELNSRIG